MDPHATRFRKNNGAPAGLSCLLMQGAPVPLSGRRCRGGLEAGRQRRLLPGLGAQRRPCGEDPSGMNLAYIVARRKTGADGCTDSDKVQTCATEGYLSGEAWNRTRDQDCERF